MYRIEIELDEEKIASHGKYTAADIHQTLDKLFSQYNLPKVQLGIYTDGGNERDLLNFMGIASGLSRNDWFTRYVKSWLWYENSTEPENLMQTFKINPSNSFLH